MPPIPDIFTQSPDLPHETARHRAFYGTAATAHTAA